MVQVWVVGENPTKMEEYCILADVVEVDSQTQKTHMAPGMYPNVLTRGKMTSKQAGHRKNISKHSQNMNFGHSCMTDKKVFVVPQNRWKKRDVGGGRLPRAASKLIIMFFQ